MSAGALSEALAFHLAGPMLYLAMVWCVLVWAVRYVSKRANWFTLGRTPLLLFWSATGIMFVGQIWRVFQSWWTVLQF